MTKRINTWNDEMNANETFTNDRLTELNGREEQQHNSFNVLNK